MGDQESKVLPDEELWELRLYVAGQTAKSIAAFANLKKVCASNQPVLTEKIMSAVLNHVNNNRLAEADVEPKVSVAARRGSASSPTATKSTDKAVLHVGFDWVTNKSCLKASLAGSNEMLL